MTKYDVIYESLQSQLNQGLISMELAEEVNDLAYEKYVVEDKSDIAAVYSRKAREEKLRSQKGEGKRPKISKNMSDCDKLSLRYYDHGSNADNEAGVKSKRGAGAARDNHKQDAGFKRDLDRLNKVDKKYYDDDTNFHYVSAYSGTGRAKRLKK